MRIIINGEPAEHREGLTILELLGVLSLEPQRVAVECNQQLIPRSRHAGTQLTEGDQLEIVTLVGGG